MGIVISLFIEGELLTLGLIQASLDRISLLQFLESEDEPVLCNAGTTMDYNEHKNMAHGTENKSLRIRKLVQTFRSQDSKRSPCRLLQPLR